MLREEVALRTHWQDNKEGIVKSENSYLLTFKLFSQCSKLKFKFFYSLPQHVAVRQDKLDALELA